MRSAIVLGPECPDRSRSRARPRVAQTKDTVSIKNNTPMCAQCIPTNNHKQPHNTTQKTDWPKMDWPKSAITPGDPRGTDRRVVGAISVPTLLVVHSVEGGVRIQSQFLFKFCKLNEQFLHGVWFTVVFVRSLIWYRLLSTSAAGLISTTDGAS